MLLAIDIGNTQMVIGGYRDSRWVLCLRYPTDHRTTSDVLGLWLLQALNQHGFTYSDIEAVCLLSVVPQLERVFQKTCQDYLKIEPLWVGRDLKVSMPRSIDAGYEPGADRLVNAYTAWTQFKKPCVVIDMGTVTTLDGVDSEGVYLGGAIMPGLEVSRQALYDSVSSGLRWPSLQQPLRMIGKNTEEQIQIGLILGYTDGIDGLVRRMQAEISEPSQVIATGGLAPIIKQVSKTIQKLDPDLTLSGLCLLYQEYIRGTRDSFIFDRPQCLVGHQEATF